MVLDYIPCDVENFSILYKDYKKIKNLTKEEDNELFFNLLDTRFCRKVLKIGSNKGKLCMKKFRSENEELLCSKHRYQEKKKCIEENCDKLLKKGKYCKKHNVPLYKKCYYYNIYDKNNSVIRINWDLLNKRNWIKIQYTTRSNGCLYGFGTNTLDLEENISYYILKRSIKIKYKLKYTFIYIYNKIKNKKYINKNINEHEKIKKVDKKMSNFLNYDKNRILYYLNSLYYLIKNEKPLNEIELFIKNMLYKINTEFILNDNKKKVLDFGNLLN